MVAPVRKQLAKGPQAAERGRGKLAKALLVVIVCPGNDGCSNELVKQAATPPEVAEGVDDKGAMMLLVVGSPQPAAFIAPGQEAVP